MTCFNGSGDGQSGLKAPVSVRPTADFFDRVFPFLSRAGFCQFEGAISTFQSVCLIFFFFPWQPIKRSPYGVRRFPPTKLHLFSGGSIPERMQERTAQDPLVGRFKTKTGRLRDFRTSGCMIVNFPLLAQKPTRVRLALGDSLIGLIREPPLHVFMQVLAYTHIQQSIGWMTVSNTSGSEAGK